MEVVILLESKFFPYREAIVESASRVLPAGSKVSSEALANDDMGGGQGVSIEVSERVGDGFDHTLRGKLVDAIKERAELEVFREWYSSFPLRSGGSPFDSINL